MKVAVIIAVVLAVGLAFELSTNSGPSYNDEPLDTCVFRDDDVEICGEDARAYCATPAGALGYSGVQCMNAGWR